MLKYIDTHAHYDDDSFDFDRDSLLQGLPSAGIIGVVNCASNIASAKKCIEIAEQYDYCWAGVGVHPHHAGELKDGWQDEIISLAKHPKVVAIAEIGLDYHYDDTDREKQSMVFRKQLDIAQKYNKPIIVHSRDSIQDTYNILKKYNLKGSIHCFSGSVEMAREFIKLGYKIGIGGIITYKNAKTIKEVVKDTDLAYILLETDSPYLAPVPHRGEDNNPKYIPIIADEIASIKGSSSLDIARVTTANAEAVFDFSCKK